MELRHLMSPLYGKVIMGLVLLFVLVIAAAAVFTVVLTGRNLAHKKGIPEVSTNTTSPNTSGANPVKTTTVNPFVGASLTGTYQNPFTSTESADQPYQNPFEQMK